MKNKFLIFISLTFFMISCNSTDLQKEFSCKNRINYNLSNVEDVRNFFSINLPKIWKINLYYDNGLSSIYAADTTVNLTKTILLDVSYIHSAISFDDNFKKKLINDYDNMNLNEIKKKSIKHLDRDAYFSLAQGKKGKFNYHVLNIFTKVNTNNTLHTKTEIYGDSLITERLCKSINLIESIKLK